MRRYTTGDRVLLDGEEWRVSEVRAVTDPEALREDPEYTQRLYLERLDAEGRAVDWATGIRNTDVEPREESA